MLVKRRNVFTHKSKVIKVGHYHATFMAFTLKWIFPKVCPRVPFCHAWFFNRRNIVLVDQPCLA